MKTIRTIQKYFTDIDIGICRTSCSETIEFEFNGKTEIVLKDMFRHWNVQK